MSSVVRASVKPAIQRNGKPLSVQELLEQGLKGADVEGFAQAADKYQGDAARELADLEAGRHPLQRRKRVR